MLLLLVLVVMAQVLEILMVQPVAFLYLAP
jgi:hypothetical protein